MVFKISQIKTGRTYYTKEHLAATIPYGHQRVKLLGNNSKKWDLNEH